MPSRPKTQAAPEPRTRTPNWIALLGAIPILIWGCAMPQVTRPREGAPAEAPAGPEKIVSAQTAAAVTFEEMLEDLRGVRVVYVGEKHTDASHHAFQLKVIQGLRERGAARVVGLEMFDRSYQAVLDRWTAGELDEESFLRAVHWYANWRFDYGLYRGILDYLRREGIRALALNLPAQIPPKIRVGGLEFLSGYEKGFIPEHVDTSIPAHRDFVRRVFERHDFQGRARFEDFYTAQCVWEDVMAESIAKGIGADPMVVLAGNGHIQFKYGIPERAFRRNPLAYRTVVLLSPGEDAAPGLADYVVTAR